MALEPIFINGKRDKARRYRDTETGEIISRRQQITRTEGVTPEGKAPFPHAQIDECNSSRSALIVSHAFARDSWRVVPRG